MSLQIQENHSSVPKRNLIRVQAGRVFTHRSMTVFLWKKLTLSSDTNEQKYSREMAHILDMFSLMGLNRPVFGIASMDSRSGSYQTHHSLK